MTLEPPSSSSRTNGGNFSVAIALAVTALSFYAIGRASADKDVLPFAVHEKADHGDGQEGKKSSKSPTRVKKLSSANLVDNVSPEAEGPRWIPSRRTLEDHMVESGGQVTVEPIGVVRSIYRLCVGTPRQGLLAPHARGRIHLHAHVSPDAVDGLRGYSHVWVLFVFHLNTTTTTSSRRKYPSKIAPPALGGRKVGVFASRSPHRFNPLGMTLVKLDHVAPSGKVLHVSGLDLVDGTPVLDVKPYIPHYDAPPTPAMSTAVRVPDWVSGGLATRRSVEVTPAALAQLQSILSHDGALEFYSAREIGGPNALLDEVKGCIEEVLSVDVRSSFQTSKARKGEFQAQRSNRLASQNVIRPIIEEVSRRNGTDPTAGTAEERCTQQLDNLLISYVIQAPSTTRRETSQGSGAEDHVIVTSIARLAAASNS